MVCTFIICCGCSGHAYCSLYCSWNVSAVCVLCKCFPARMTRVRCFWAKPACQGTAGQQTRAGGLCGFHSSAVFDNASEWDSTHTALRTLEDDGSDTGRWGFGNGISLHSRAPGGGGLLTDCRSHPGDSRPAARCPRLGRHSADIYKTSAQ